VPTHPAHAAPLAAWRKTGPTVLVTSFGKPFAGNGRANFMADRIGEAKHPDTCVTHGLRKAAAWRLEEAEYPANEIAAISGHATLIKVARCTHAADQTRMARSAINRLPIDFSAHKHPNRSVRFEKTDEKQ